MSIELLSAYSAPTGRFDEMRAESGGYRPHWAYVMRALESMPPDHRTQRQAELRRLLLESGIAYHVYSDSGTRTRRWPLDIIPFVISSQEWRGIEEGVAQRAELLGLIYADLYGPQTLIRSGLLPAQVVYGHPGFLLPCLSVPQSADLPLSIYAADIARRPDGRWCVTDDRTQAPSGIGYALASRTAMARMLPSVFRDANVHPVMPFLRDLRSRLMHLADNEPDRIAILSPGAANETYPEQAYLARQLGLPLVEGDDLEISRGRCYFNEHDGQADADAAGDARGSGLNPQADARQQLSVLLRRMDDDYCDPLELNRNSMLGTAGFLQAIRSRNLASANPLGTGVLENPALMAFLPRLCKSLLGQDLRLPSVDSWWCGEPESLREVESRFDELVIRRFRASAQHPPVVVRTLNSEQKAELLKLIRARPDAYAAQRVGGHSTAPVYTKTGLEARPVELRTFAVARQGSYRVMSGGMARVGQHAESTRFSAQLGGPSKDVWVLASEPLRSTNIEHALSLNQMTANVPAYALRPATITQPHLADNLIWLGRYLVRAMQLNRLISQASTRLLQLETSDTPPDPLTRVILRAITWQSALYPGFIGDQSQQAINAPLPELLRVLNAEADGGMRHDLNAIATCAQELQSQLASDTSVAASALGELRMPDAQAAALQDVALTCQDLAQALPALLGLLMNTLPTDGPRALLETGMALELGLATNRLVRSMLVGIDAPALTQGGGDMLADEAAQTTLLLAASPPPLTPATDSAASVLRELIASSRNPRSVRHQILRLQQLTPRLKRPRADEQSAAGAQESAAGRESDDRITQQPSGSSRRIQEALARQLERLDALPLTAMASEGDTGGQLDRSLEQLDIDLRKTANQVIERLTRRRRAPVRQLPPPPAPEART